ncbi:hypothetical protein Tco_1067628 [Tanacetum coccineum]|uniref:Uncharacterized protein n=1 Tax=Tanacetum coccineum TaxID=301880 RepID=A0ABQ5HDE9_9ASTR
MYEVARPRGGEVGRATRQVSGAGRLSGDLCLEYSFVKSIGGCFYSRLLVESEYQQVVSRARLETKQELGSEQQEGAAV